MRALRARALWALWTLGASFAFQRWEEQATGAAVSQDDDNLSRLRAVDALDADALFPLVTLGALSAILSASQKC